MIFLSELQEKLMLFITGTNIKRGYGAKKKEKRVLSGPRHV